MNRLGRLHLPTGELATWNYCSPISPDWSARRRGLCPGLVLDHPGRDHADRPGDGRARSRASHVGRADGRRDLEGATHPLPERQGPDRLRLLLSADQRRLPRSEGRKAAAARGQPRRADRVHEHLLQPRHSVLDQPRLRGLRRELRGSTGYGRDFRHLLRGGWGVVDVEDHVAAARHLVAEGLVDPERLAVRGWSAGGYNTFAALAFADTFQAGASYFGISDVAYFASQTHKFESRYADYLVGPRDTSQALYRERSPSTAPTASPRRWPCSRRARQDHAQEPVRAHPGEPAQAWRTGDVHAVRRRGARLPACRHQPGLPQGRARLLRAPSSRSSWPTRCRRS